MLKGLNLRLTQYTNVKKLIIWVKWALFSEPVTNISEALKELKQIYEAWAAKTKLIIASLYFHLAAIFSLTFFPNYQTFLFVFD